MAMELPPEEDRQEVFCPWSGEPVIVVKIGDRWHARVPNRWTTKGYENLTSLYKMIKRRHTKWKDHDDPLNPVCPFTGGKIKVYPVGDRQDWKASTNVWFSRAYQIKGQVLTFLGGVDGKFPPVQRVQVVDREPPMRDYIREEALEREKAVRDVVNEAHEKGLLPDPIDGGS